ncbi:oxidoreductase-like protein, partial [Elsinoe ampelina]
PPTHGTPSPAQPAPVSERETVEARARVVFGSRLAGPERKRELDKGATYIAGVKIPARPEEPDNCCMSGCVNCVWDLYRDELEEWAAANAEAKAKLAAMKAEKQEGGEEIMGEGLSTGIGKVPTHVAVSMDDDGGGSETNWTLNSGEDDLFGGIPVGIREFMRTEKMLKQRH